MEKLSDNLFAGIGLETTDIIGASATSLYLDMGTFDDATFLVVLGAAWDAGETLDLCKLVQATDAGGTGSNDIVGKAIVANDPSTAGEVYALEVKAEDLDLAGGFNFVACKVANEGIAVLAPVTIIKMGHNLRKKYANVLGATARV